MSVPTQARSAQAEAARPDRSAWVSANAGSGKTRVLTNRVARLLLGRTDPQKILCLTFTNAAAAEMQNRLFGQLGEWAMLPEEALRDRLAELGATREAADGDGLREARRLFARALETPGGLRIQTIHAFCDRLLRRFPLEAGVAPDFTELDPARGRELVDGVLDDMADDAGAAAFDAVARYLSGNDPGDLIAGILSVRSRFRGPFDEDALRRALGAPAGRTVAGILADVLANSTAGDLRAFCDILLAGSTNDRKAGQALASALGQTDPDRILAGLEKVFLTGGNTNAPYTAKTDSLPTKATRAANPDLVARIEPLMRAVEAARDQHLSAAAFARALALNRFARAFLSRYDAGKRARGLLDFDDLIEMAGGLLGDARVADWVLYRLDGGIDHILVDEAQDISPAQWRVIDAVSREFFAGEGARRAERTVFAVGDFKQSIYSFQGAEPAIFDDMRRAYASRAKGSGKKFRNCELLHSFRSAPPILELVDRIFSGPERGGVSGEIRHLAAHGGKPGRIDVWPFVEPDEKAPPEPWYQPVDMPPAREPARRISGAVAAEISGWLKAGRILPGQNRPIRAGDILILVRSRGALFRGVIKELKERGVEVAGADKFRIGQELAVMDLLSVLRFLSTPSDDLSLAEALRSPVFGLGEADLFSLAHGRAGTLWQALEKSEAEFPETLAMLRDLFRHADYERPYEMLERVLTQHGARARILARMGGESADALDELLVQALAYERTEAPSLTGFIEWMEASEVEVNRQTDALTDRVRVMTVHGAKGLGSPIVILPDTLPLRNRKPSPVIRIGDGLAAWRGPGDQPDSLQAEADRQAALAAEEEMRLLYVALTRAEHWLLVCGGGQARYRPGSWYERISVAVAGMGAARAPAPDGIDGESLSLARDWTAGPVDGGAPGESPQIAELPDWAVSPAPEVAARPAPVSPSGLGGEHALPGETDVTSEEAARRRGSLLHLLLQALPCLPAPDRRDAALRILANAGAEPSRDDPEALAAEAMAVVETPELAAVFAEGALTEVPVTAELPELGGRRISGRIDRLLVSGNEILAVDFKSNRVIPRTAEEVPEGILRQMGAYRAALGGIWPDRSVRTAILWTASRSLMALPGEIVAAALARAGAP